MTADEARAEVERKFGKSIKVLETKGSADEERALNEIVVALCISEIMGDYKDFRIKQLEGMVQAMVDVRAPIRPERPNDQPLVQRRADH